MAKSKQLSEPKAKKETSAKSKPTREQIAQRAYEIYLERGATPGDPMQDWLRAEQELNAPKGKSRPKSKVITFAA
ncbi:MAG TPA: DUF2934 domain-containing protein [Terriglobales bacterium]|nr:DUF2934 domain-containing protein [Terriglobales bacterium]